MNGTGVSNANWIDYKKSVTRKFDRSSFAVGLDYLERRFDFHEATGLSPDEFRAEGEAVPLVVKGKGRVGTLVMSGL